MSVDNESGFHNKYRPKTLDEVIGHEKIVATLKGMIEKDKFPSCIAFFGPPSAGKTTLASALVRDTIGNSKSDFTYMNMAESKTIEDVRQVIQISNLSPTMGKRRFILLDEMQGLLSNPQATAAILPKLELPHKKMTWLIASMSPEKFTSSTNGKAVLSRSTQFHLQPFSEEEMLKQLKRISKGEGMSYLTKDIAHEIIKNSQGEMRTLANLMEGLFNYYEGLPKKEQKDKLDIEDIQSVISLQVSSDDTQAIRLLTAIYAKKFMGAQKEVLNIQDGFAVIQKMLYANYSVMNDAVLGGARHPKVWMTEGARNLRKNIEVVLETSDKTKIVKSTSFVQSCLVRLKTQAMQFQVPEDMALSAFAYETIKALKTIDD